MAWFRFYDEAVSDKKLHKIARDTGIEFLQVLGFWAAVLSLANDSPERGVLLITDTDPVTLNDVSQIVHCDFSTLETLCAAFLKAKMLTRKRFKAVTCNVSETPSDSCVLSVVNWNKRQFSSDQSTARVRKHREVKRPGNVSETFLKRSSRARTDTDTDTDTEVHPPSPLDIDQASVSPKDASGVGCGLADLFSQLLARAGKGGDHFWEMLAAWRREYGDAVTRHAILAGLSTDEPPKNVGAFVDSVARKLKLGNIAEQAKAMLASGLKPFEHKGASYYVDDLPFFENVPDRDLDKQLAKYEAKHPNRVFRGAR